MFCSKSRKWNEVLGGNDFLNCFDNYFENSDNDFKCYKKGPIQQNDKSICQKCGQNYISINKDINNNDNSLINCYKTKEGFYLYVNGSTPIFLPCYRSCKICQIRGNKTYHNCIVCKDNYQLELIYEIYINCYISNFKQSYNYTDNKTEFDMIKENLLKQYKETQIIKGEDIETEIENILITLTTTDNQKNEINKNRTTIDLGKCEDILKKEYNISLNSSLYILKLDAYESGMKIPKIEYEVYFPLNNEGLTKLNLTKCKDIKIDISIPVRITGNLEKYNSSSNFYNDICSKTESKSGIDITLADRRNNFIDNNMSLCEEDCNLVKYNYTEEKAKCSCFVKLTLPSVKDIKFNKNKFYQSFIDVNYFANLKFMKCYKIVLTVKNLKKNFGFFLFIFIFISYIISLFLFYFKFYSILKKDIKKIKKAKIKIIKYLRHKSKKILGYKQKNIGNVFENPKNKNPLFPPVKMNSFKKGKKDLYINNNFNETVNTSKKLKFIFPQEYKNSYIYKTIDMPTIKIENKYNEILKYNDYELNNLQYKKAVNYDKRTFCQYYFSLLKTGHLFIFSFYSDKTDYNSQIIKIFLFFFFFAVHFTINALFFNDATMHKIYIDEGKFNFLYQISQIIYSNLISSFVNFIIIYFSLSGIKILELKNKKSKKSIKVKFKEILKVLKIKFALFFVISFLLLLIFMYYITCFCGIYTNTQVHLIKDSVISFGLTLIEPFGIYLVPGLFRFLSLRGKMKNKECLYKISLFIQNI